jgi:hypothetical protein
MTATDNGLYVYAAILWIAFFGMVAFPAHSPVTRRAKALAGLTFVLLCLDAWGLLRGLEV